MIRRIEQQRQTEVSNLVELLQPNIVKNSLAILRNRNTEITEFRRHADIISSAIGHRLAEDLPLIAVQVKTPVGTAESEVLNSKYILLIAILRSGYPITVKIGEILSGAKIALIDIKRDEETAKPKLFYDGLVDISLENYAKIIIPDPMLATGGSCLMAIDLLKSRGVKNIRVVSIVSAPEGIYRIKKEHPDVQITTCAIDYGLNRKKFIIPGLGDFGNRYYEGEEPIFFDRNNDVSIVYKNGLPIVRNGSL